MALELLAGPFTLSSTLGDSVRITIVGGVTLGWYDTMGLFSVLDIYNDGVFVTQGIAVIVYDGQCFLRGPAFSGFSKWFGVDAPSKGLLAGVGTNVTTFDPRTGGRGDTLFAHVGSQSIVRLTDRLLRTTAAFGHYTIETSTDGATWTTEKTITGSGTGTASFTLLKTGKLIIGWTNGWVTTYDTIAQEQVGVDKHVGYTTGLMGIWYSEKHRFFVALYNAGSNVYHLRIWADVPLPSALSNPTASPALTKGRVSTLTVTLTGSNGEPCVGELVDWTLTGDGALSSSQSTTDASGHATTEYIAPVDSLPTVTIDAEVLI